jgi:hypothetical protein
VSSFATASTPGESLRTPKVFIASSTETLGTAEALRLSLARLGVGGLIWNRAFKLSRTNIENLETIGAQVSGAVFVMGAEDALIFRARKFSAVRDNVLFELGLFVGKLGRSQCVAVTPSTINWRWPSDLDGVATIRMTASMFRPAGAKNLAANAEIRRMANRLAAHFLVEERQRWGQMRMNVGYFLRAVRDTYVNRLKSLRPSITIPNFRLNLMTPASDRALCIACVDYESDFHEKEFEKRWLEGEGKCGHAWQHGIQAIYGEGLHIAEAGLTKMRGDALPRIARDRRSVLSTPVVWRETPVGVLNFDSAEPARRTLVHNDAIRECFLMAAGRVAHLVYATR